MRPPATRHPESNPRARPRVSLRASGVLLLLLSACGSRVNVEGDSGVFDCAWVNENNCWRRALADVEACLPQDETATLSADGKSCTYASGPAIAFPYPNVDNDPFIATATNGEASCYEYELDHAPDAASMALTTASGRVALEFHKDENDVLSLVITCPDASVARTDDYSGTLEECPSNEERWPGRIHQEIGTDSVFSYSLGGGNGGDTALFRYSIPL